MPWLSLTTALLMYLMSAGLINAGLRTRSKQHAFGRNPTYYNRSSTSQYPGTRSYDCTPGGPPRIPNTLQPMAINPKAVLGRWYTYAQYYDGIAEDIYEQGNSVAYYDALALDTLHPATGSSAVLVEQKFPQLDTRTGHCYAPYPIYLGYATPEGTLSGLGTGNYTSYTVDNSVTLSTDYDTYWLSYECFKYNVHSGHCDDPYVFLYTRQRPDQLPSSVADNLSALVEGLLGRYCFSMDMMVAGIWIPELGLCPPVPATDPCYNALRQAHLSLAGAEA